MFFYFLICVKSVCLSLITWLSLSLASVRGVCFEAAGVPVEILIQTLILSRSPVELFNVYSVKDMTFNPPVAPPGTKKKVRKSNAPQSIFPQSQLLIDYLHVYIHRFVDKVCKTVLVYQDRFVIGATLLDDELQRRVESVVMAAEGAELDFNTKCTNTHTHTAAKLKKKKKHSHEMKNVKMFTNKIPA